MSIRLKLVASVVAATLAGSALAQSAASKPERIRGDIVSFSGSSLKVHRRSGETVLINVAPSANVNAVKAIQLSDIKPGSYVGAAAMPGENGKLIAKEVLVFPEAARGMGEGHYAWDLAANSTMTNASVDTVVQGTSGRDLKLSYKAAATRSRCRRRTGRDARPSDARRFVDGQEDLRRGHAGQGRGLRRTPDRGREGWRRTSDVSRPPGGRHVVRRRATRSNRWARTGRRVRDSVFGPTVTSARRHQSKSVAMDSARHASMSWRNAFSLRSAMA